MREKIVQLNGEVQGSNQRAGTGNVEETLNKLLEVSAQKLTQVARGERNKQRQGYRSGRCKRLWKDRFPQSVLNGPTANPMLPAQSTLTFSCADLYHHFFPYPARILFLFFLGLT